MGNEGTKKQISPVIRVVIIQNRNPFPWYFGVIPSRLVGPSKFLGKNFIEEYPHNSRITKTPIEKVFGYMFLEEADAYFRRSRIRSIGRIIIRDRGAI
jgi:hypothetical protein